MTRRKCRGQVSDQLSLARVEREGYCTTTGLRLASFIRAIRLTHSFATVFPPSTLRPLLPFPFPFQLP